ncbi:hypothetical protein [Halorussus caseinilyticus]|uniref:Citrate transporter n=1 Tax=Halorussus caseinilyticus TaxID=3034025 RepID=A0ABD5WH98_9EURY|nr:hypothetical protein [Halorussus sp. DT72]
MDEAALIPTMLYVLLTTLMVAWAVRSFDWFHVTAASAAAVALALLLEGGLAYEGVKRAMEY